jgi:hypothetical protein
MPGTLRRSSQHLFPAAASPPALQRAINRRTLTPVTPN